jgi:hypothetical protein
MERGEVLRSGGDVVIHPALSNRFNGPLCGPDLRGRPSTMAPSNHHDHHDVGVHTPVERMQRVPNSGLLAGEEVDPL